MQLSRRPLQRTLDTRVCFACKWRSFNSSCQRNAEKGTSNTSPAQAQTSSRSPLDDAPRAYGKSVEEFTPKPLNRPIGLPRPPRAGENTGIDTRTWRQRRDDFTNYDKHLVKRKELKQKISQPYFREWSNMRHHKGKSFLAPPRLFKAEHALYFPNLYGETLVPSQGARDTTPELEGKVSVVSVFSSAWAERQAASFVAVKNNPELHEVVKGSGGIAQMVQINIEENALKAMIIKLFMSNLRRTIDKKDWARYFVVRSGLGNEMRDAIGLLNSKVGYTYLLDGSCKIRWAGSGLCEGDEKGGLVRGVRRLIDDAKTSKSVTISESQGKKNYEAARAKDLSKEQAAAAA